MKRKRYIFNECDICVNPETIQSEIKVPKYEAQKDIMPVWFIEIAKIRQSWIYGCGYEDMDEKQPKGYYYPCSRNGKKFRDKRHAVIAAARFLRRRAGVVDCDTLTRLIWDNMQISFLNEQILHNFLNR